MRQTKTNSFFNVPRPVATACSLALLSAPFAPLSASADEISVSSALTSDYVWRGSSQTRGKPALQAGVKAASERTGMYASVWASNVRFDSAPQARHEADVIVGWSRSIDPKWSLDINATRYLYPGVASLNWNELNASTTWRDRAWIGIGLSDNAMATGSSGRYVHGGFRIPLRERVKLELGAARYAVNDALGGYNHGWASLNWAVAAPLELRITAHATDGAAKTRFGDDVAGSRIEAALQASF